MKKRDISEIKTKSQKEIALMIKDLEKEKVNLQLELKMGKAKNVHAVGRLKRSIARARTIARLKEIVDMAKSVSKKEEGSQNAAG